MLYRTGQMVYNAKKRGAIGTFRIDPELFLSLTSNKRRARIEKEALEIEDYNALIQVGEIDCIPYIKILPNGKVVGHEGRHRSQSVLDAGGKYVTVALIVVKPNPDPAKAKNKKAKDQYVPLAEKFVVSDVPGIWTAQFSNSRFPVPLRNFRKI